MAIPNPNVSLNLQKQGISKSLSNSCPKPRNILRARRRGHVSTNGFPNPTQTPRKRILRALRRGHVSQGSRGTHESAMSSSNSCPNPAPTPGRSFQLASHRKTDPDEREQPLSVAVKSSLSRSCLNGGLVSYRSAPTPSAPPLPPREHKEEINEDSLADKLQLSLTKSLEDTKGQSSKASSYEEEDSILLDNIQKMKLEDSQNDEEDTCVICMDKPKTHAYIPCGHRVVCVKCSEELKTKGKLNCVICRKEAHDIYQIF